MYNNISSPSCVILIPMSHIRRKPRPAPKVTFYCITCFSCLGQFHHSQLEQGRGKYCSNRCANLGKNSYAWKGDCVSYNALHKWIKRNFGDPPNCTKCGKTGSKEGRCWNIEWANISGEYKREISDFTGLCRSCHRRHDILFAGNQVKNQYGVFKLRHSRDQRPNTANVT